MRHHISALIRAVLRTDHSTYYCASCGGWYPIGHFCP